MEYKNIKFSIEDGIAVIAVNRPKAYNATNTPTILEMEKALMEIEASPEARVLIVTGSEKVFVAGADVMELIDADSLAAYENCSNAHRVYEHIENLKLPTIAAVNGPALGGGMELALSCDFRIAGEGALFGLPEVTLGIIPGAGGTQRLTTLVGPSVAKEMVFLGTRIKADKALEIGLINQLVPDAEVMDTAKGMAEKLKKMPAVALRLAKESINFCCNMNSHIGREFEKARFAMAFSTEDQKEGMKAFIEKRKPSFNNK